MATTEAAVRPELLAASGEAIEGACWRCRFDELKWQKIRADPQAHC